MNQKLGYTGICHIDIFKNDEFYKSLEIQNQLTYGGQYCILRGLTDDTKNQLTKAVFGSGTTVSLAVSNTLGEIEDKFDKYLTLVKPSTISESPCLTAKWRLEVSEYNGYTISELGLSFLDDGSADKLFCRVTLSTADYIYKTSDIALSGYWTITVTES